MDPSFLVAEMFLKEAKKNINEKNIQIADYKLKKSISIFTDLILKNHDKEFLSELFLNRALAYKDLENTNNFDHESNYFIDIKSSCVYGNEIAEKEFLSENFKKKFDKYKIIFVCDFNFSDNEIIDFSSMFMYDQYFHQNIDCVYISKEKKIKAEFDLKYHKTFDYENYSKIVLRLIHGILVSDNFICLNFNKTKEKLNRILKTAIIDEIFNDNAGKDLYEEIDKFKKSKMHLNTSVECYNHLFNKQFPNENNTMINSILIAECFRFILHCNNLPLNESENLTVKAILNI